MTQYCLKCGEAIESTDTKYMVQIGGKEYIENIGYCGNSKCPRYGLHTQKIQNTLEKAKKLRKKFAKKK